MGEERYKGETRPYELENGAVYNMPAVYCTFCKHCTDVIYDYTHGPYMCMCDKGLDITEGEYVCTCEGFEDNGYVFDEEDYKKRMQAKREMKLKHLHLMKTDPEYKKAYEDTIDTIFNRILYGEGKND